MNHSSRIINHGAGHRVYEIASGGTLCTQGIYYIQMHICITFCYFKSLLFVTALKLSILLSLNFVYCLFI